MPGETHGLSRYLGTLSAGLGGLPVVATACIVCFLILLLTELTSNTATAATFLPIVAATAVSLGQNPLLFLIPAALASNCAFMLPVGTPPNAIAFGSGFVTLPQMAKTGFLLNLVMVPVIVALVLLLGPLVFDLRLDTMPAWLAPPSCGLHLLIRSCRSRPASWRLRGPHSRCGFRRLASVATLVRCVAHRRGHLAGAHLVGGRVARAVRGRLLRGVRHGRAVHTTTAAEGPGARYARAR